MLFRSGVEDQIVVIYGGMVEFLESLILTKSGELHNRHYIAGRGDYPIVATTGSRTFACWVGSPASPIEYQDRARKEAQTDAWVSHYLSQLEDKDDNRRELIPLVRQSGSAVQNHHTPTLRDFMHGLWLGGTVHRNPNACRYSRRTKCSTVYVIPGRRGYRSLV